MLSALSPSRRRLVVGTVLLLVAALVAAVLAVLAGRRGDGPAAPQDRLGPVLLVPGYGGSTVALQSLAARLRSAGRDARLVAVPDGGTGDLAGQARTLAAAVDGALRGTGAPSVDVVGYSAGGVVARLWARDDGGRSRARRIVTLGSPQHGTRLAGLAGALAPDRCPAACQQLVPGSAVLTRLNSGDETPDGPLWVSLWSTADQVVTPPDSARLGGAAVNLPVQDVCPGSRVAHGALPTDPAVQDVVLAELRVTPPVQRPSVDCRVSS